MNAEELEREVDAVIADIGKSADTFNSNVKSLLNELMTMFDNSTSVSDTVKVALVEKLGKTMDSIGERFA